MSLVFWENTLFFIIAYTERSHDMRFYGRVVPLLVKYSLFQLYTMYLQ